MWEEIFKCNKKTINQPIKKYLDTVNFVPTFKIIHVVGTNGKGSVSNYLYQGLRENKISVGLFTSPHIMKPNERIVANGRMISDKEFWSIHSKLDIKHFHFFAQMYIVALFWFNEQGCDFVVMEAGIGGKEDTTAIFEGEFVVLTSISFDHTELLGNTLIDIAKQKKEICNNCVAYYPSTIIDEVDEYLTNNNSVKILMPNNLNYQERNMLLATKVLKLTFNIEKNKFSTPTGRSEILNWNDKKIAIDVAHNSDGIKESLKFLNEKKFSFDDVLVMSKVTKDVTELSKIFTGKNIYFYQKDQTFHDLSCLNFKKVTSLKTFLNLHNGNLLCIGSFYLAGEIYEIIN